MLRMFLWRCNLVSGSKNAHIVQFSEELQKDILDRDEAFFSVGFFIAGLLCISVSKMVLVTFSVKEHMFANKEKNPTVTNAVRSGNHSSTCVESQLRAYFFSPPLFLQKAKRFACLPEDSFL